MKIHDVIIVDDEREDAEVLRASLSRYKDVAVRGTANTAAAGKELILNERPGLVFLDVELPDMTGLELLGELEGMVTWKMQVVFYTSYEKYLLKALRQSAFDFLLKPYKKSELQEVMDRFLSQDFDEQSPNFPAAGFLSGKQTFMVATITGYQLLRLEQIGYFVHQKKDKQWYVVLHDQTRMQLKRNSNAEEILNLSVEFVQVSQQIIINVNYLTMIEGKLCILDPPFDKKQDITISRYYLKKLQEKINMM